MKKIIMVIILTFIFILNTNAKKIKVEFDKCIDGDTISIKNNEIYSKIRFLAIDAPEIDKQEPYSTEAKEYLCNLIKNGKNLYLEFDNKSDKVDKYDRTLAWVWIDDTLIQYEMVKNGYAKVAYLYNEYKYTSELKKFEEYAKDNKLNIWSDYVPVIKKEKKKINKDSLLDKINKYYDAIVIVIAMILALITLSLTKQKKNKKFKK